MKYGLLLFVLLICGCQTAPAVTPFCVSRRYIPGEKVIIKATGWQGKVSQCSTYDQYKVLVWYKDDDDESQIEWFTSSELENLKDRKE